MQQQRVAAGRDVLMCVATEAAGEISRIYEYQLAMLGGGDTETRLMAEVCADRALDYALIGPTAPRRIDRNTVVHGVVRGVGGCGGGATSTP